MAVRFPETGSTLSRRENSRQTDRRATRTRPGRLFCFETEAFSVLSNESRHIAKLPWRKHSDIDRNGSRYLRSFYRQRRLHARSAADRAAGLCRLRKGRAEPARAKTYAARAEG